MTYERLTNEPEKGSDGGNANKRGCILHSIQKRPSSMTENSRAVVTGPVSPVSTGPLFPSPVAYLASPISAIARRTPT